MATTIQFTQPIGWSFTDHPSGSAAAWFAAQAPALTVTSEEKAGQVCTVEVSEDPTQEEVDAIVAKLHTWPVPA